MINVLLFVAAVGILAVLGYQATFGGADAETERIIDEQIQTLAEHYAKEGALSLRNVIRNRAAWRDDSLYMLIGAPNGVRLEGDLSSLPEEALDAGEGIFEFTYGGRPQGDDADLDAGDATRKAAGKVVRFRPEVGADPAFIILIARDITSQENLRERLNDVIWRIGLTTIGLGLVIGWIFSRSLMRQVEAMNKTAGQIRKGDLSKRIPLTGAGDEMEQLARNLNAMLDQIERLMTGMKEVSDNIAHDLRSPLTRIRNRLTVALESEGRAKDAELKATMNEAERMITTFNELLSIARIESGEVTGTREAVDISSIAEQLAELYEPAALESGFELRLNASDVPKIQASRALISQAVANLLDNAIKYATGGAVIEISTRVTKAGFVEIAVEDDGPGIPESRYQDVLQRYARLEESRTTQGNGLGLSLVSAIAQAHDAQVIMRAGDHEKSQSALLPGLKIVIRFPKMEKQQRKSHKTQ